MPGSAEALNGTRNAVLATDGYERAELEQPVLTLREAGALPVIVSLGPGAIRRSRMAVGPPGHAVRFGPALQRAFAGGRGFRRAYGSLLGPDPYEICSQAAACKGAPVKVGRET